VVAGHVTDLVDVEHVIGDALPLLRRVANTEASA
jgi:hypothetical protein